MFLTVFLFFLVSVGSVQFSFAQGALTAPQKSFFKPFEFGVQLENYRYVEPGLISHTGILFGVYGIAAWSYSENASGLILGQINSGELNYDGALCDVNTNVCTSYKAKTNDVILRLTHRFDYLLFGKLHLFIGPGFRYLLDRGQGTGFYTRMATYFFMPAGFSVDVAHYKFEVEYDFLLRGMIKSHLSEVNSTYDDITHSQEDGKAFRVTALARFSQLTTLPVELGLYYEKRELPSSDLKELRINKLPSGQFYKEPENITEALGVKLGVIY